VQLVLVPQNGGQYSSVVMTVKRPFGFWHETVFRLIGTKVPARRADIQECIWVAVGVKIITLSQCDIMGLYWRITTLRVQRPDAPLSVYAEEYFGP